MMNWTSTSTPFGLSDGTDFFINETATTEIYTLSLHDALPIFVAGQDEQRRSGCAGCSDVHDQDRKSTRLNSSHSSISYAVVCLKKKKEASSNIYWNVFTLPVSLRTIGLLANGTIHW